MRTINRKLKLIIVLILVLIETTTLFLMYKSFSNRNIEQLNTNISNSKDTFAILIEQSDGSYKESSNTSWSTEYLFNEEHSVCVDINGKELKNVLTFDSKTNKALLTTKTATFCYLYFDIKHPAYAIYSEDDYSLTFVRSETPYIAGDTYNDKTITAVYTGFENTLAVEDSNFSLEAYLNANLAPWYEYSNIITKVQFVDEIIPVSTAYWFYCFRNLENINLTSLDTSNVTNMSHMFENAAISGLDLTSWDVSNVTNMSSMFAGFGEGKYSNNISIDITDWNTSKVTNMSKMFYFIGHSAMEVNLKGLSTIDTSSVTDMSYMFADLAIVAESFHLNLSNWNTSKVTNMSHMFQYTGGSATDFGIEGILGWATGNVTDMSYMFDSTATGASSFKLDLSGWDVSKVSDYDNFSNNNNIVPPKW